MRADHGDENLAAIRRIALNLLKQEKTAQVGIANKRLQGIPKLGVSIKSRHRPPPPAEYRQMIWPGAAGRSWA